MNKKYWLRGGIIGLIFVILASFLMLTNRDLAESLIFNPLIKWLNYVISYPMYLVFGSKVSPLTHYVLWVEYFFIGAIIGWLYGKIKNRKKVV